MKLFPYQRRTIKTMLNRDLNALFIEMGLGKTVMTLTWLSVLLGLGKIKHALVIAPLRVTNTVWKQEAEKWPHLQHLKVNICTGTPEERLAALQDEADIYCINRENIAWLYHQLRYKSITREFNALVIDESTSFKDQSTLRFKSIMMIIKHCRIKKRAILTGTPSPNSLMDLWAQYKILDEGHRLHPAQDTFRKALFEYNSHAGKWKPKLIAKKIIHKAVRDITVTLKAKDYIDVPDLVENDIMIDLSNETMKAYKKLEKEFIIALRDETITVMNAGAMATKLLQVCSGAVYPEPENPRYIDMHYEKLDALKELLNDNPMEHFLIAYFFRFDHGRLGAHFPEGRFLDKKGDSLRIWNAGLLRLLFAHPQSAGHGINAQYGGNSIIWYGLTWSAENYLQFNARLHRQGQGKPVTVNRLITRGTVEERLIWILRNRTKEQNDLVELFRIAYDLI